MVMNCRKKGMRNKKKSLTAGAVKKDFFDWARAWKGLARGVGLCYWGWNAFDLYSTHSSDGGGF